MTDESSELIGVILAAGRGSRMMNLPTCLPKPALPILDKPILYYQLEAMASVGISKAIVVVGYRSFEIVRLIERLPDMGIEIEYVHQQESLGIAHCVGQLESLVRGPFVLFLGDIYFQDLDLAAMLAEFGAPGVDAIIGAIEEEDTAAITRNFCIVTDADGRATAAIEKPRYPQSRLKGVGIYVFEPAVFDAIRRTPRTALRDEYELTDSIQILITDGYNVRPSNHLSDDINITYPADLCEVNLAALRHESLDYYLADSAVVSPSARVLHSVVGSGAAIADGAHLRNTVVFAGGVVPPGADLDGVIVTESEIFKI